MAKLTRRQRNELKNNPNKQKKNGASKERKSELRVPKKKHICVFHKYQEQADGTFVCLTCGHHFEKKMNEAGLRKYLYMKRDYSLSELKEMDSHIVEVTYGKDTRGVVYEADVRELNGWDAINMLSDIWQYFRCVRYDLEFEQEGLLEVDWLYNFETDRYCKEEQWVPTYEQLESIFTGMGYVDIEEFWNTEKEWCYKTLDGKMHWYGVYPVLNGRMVEFPGLYYFNKDRVAARKYVFLENGELEKATIRLWDGGIYSLSK